MPDSIDLDEAAKHLPSDILYNLYKHVYAYHIAEQKARLSLVHAELLLCRRRTPCIQDLMRTDLPGGYNFNIFRIMSGLGGLCYSY